MSHSKSSHTAAPKRATRRSATAGGKTASDWVANEHPAPDVGSKRTAVPFAVAESVTLPGMPESNRTWKFSYLSVYHASPLERISLIKQGVQASQLKQLFADLNIAQGVGIKALNLSTATVNKKAKNGEVLSSDESERVVGFAKLVGQLEAMVEESGDGSDFDAHAWIARWLTEPLPAFGGTRPVDLIDTMEGQGLVSSALAKLQSGAYA